MCDGNGYNDDTKEGKIYRSSCEWGNIGKIITLLRMNGIYKYFQERNGAVCRGLGKHC